MYAWPSSSPPLSNSSVPCQPLCFGHPDNRSHGCPCARDRTRQTTEGCPMLRHLVFVLQPPKYGASSPWYSFYSSPLLGLHSPVTKHEQNTSQVYLVHTRPKTDEVRKVHLEPVQRPSPQREKFRRIQFAPARDACCVLVFPVKKNQFPIGMCPWLPQFPLMQVALIRVR